MSAGTPLAVEENVLLSDMFVWVRLCHNLLVFCIDHHAKEGKRARTKNKEAFLSVPHDQVGCRIGWPQQNLRSEEHWRQQGVTDMWFMLSSLCRSLRHWRDWHDLSLTPDRRDHANSDELPLNASSTSVDAQQTAISQSNIPHHVKLVSSTSLHH